jgi:autotransporter-associated beta strand protein
MNPKKSFHPGSSRFFLTFVCGSLLTALPATADTTAIDDFSSGFPASGSGDWINSWTNATSTASIPSRSAASGALVVTTTGTGASGGVASVSRQYTANTLDIPTIFFDFTIGSFPTAGGTAQQDRFELFGGSSRQPGVSGSASWLILGGQNLSFFKPGLGANWGFYNGAGDGAAFNGANLVDSGIPLVLGNTYRFTIFDDPSTGTYIASVDNLDDPAGAFTTGSLGYRGAALADPHIHFAARVSNSGDTAGFTVDNVSIVPVAPALVTTVPAANATNVAIGANLTATFTESVVAGTGNVELWQVGGGSPVESFDVASSPQLTFSGATLTIDPTANLTSGVEYYILIPATAVVDTTGGDAFAGILDPTAWSFTTDGTAPTLVSRNPANNTPSFPVASNLVATFSEAVLAGTGNIELWQVGGDEPVESFEVSPLSSRLTLSGSTLTIDPTADLTPGVGYYVLIASTAFVDAGGLPFAGISDPTAWNFTGDNTGAIFDDFNDGNDNGWTRLSPLTVPGAPAVYSFPGGNRYQISSPVSPNPGLFGPARAGSLRLDQSYATYFQQSVDIVDWDNTQSGTTIGMLARVSNAGLGTTDGYSLTVNLNGVFEINRITDEQSAAVIATASIAALNSANDYRLVFIGEGSTLIGQIFNLANLSTPIATISGIDATYASGNSGLFIFSSSDTQTASATFDNYASATFGTPIVKADNTDNLNSGTSWVGGVAPTFADRAKWDDTVKSANTTSLGADLTFGGIVIANPTGPVTINPGNTLSLGAGLVDIDLSAATQDLTLNCALSMGAPNVWDVTSGRTLALGGVVSGSAGVTKQGAGTAILSNANGYTGGTAISAGTLQLSGSGTLGAAGASVAVSSGALLDLNGTSQSIAFTAGTGAGTVANNAGSGTSTLTLSASPAANVIIADNTNSSAGKVAVVVPVNCSGLSTSNTYSGGTTVNAGAFFYNSSPGSAGSGTITLPASGANAAASSGLLVNGGIYANDVSGAGYIHNNVNGTSTAKFTGTLNTSGTFNFRNSAAAFEFAGSGNSTLSGVIGPAGAAGVYGPNITVSTGSVIKSGTGTLTLSGNNLYTGSTTVSGGTLVLLGGSQVSPITVQDGATLGFDIASPTTSTKSVTLNAGHKIRVSVPPVLTEPSYTLLTTTATITGAEPNLDPAIPGYDVIVDGTNTLKLVAANTFASWISKAEYGLAVADQDLGDDPDGDGIDNGVENFFGTNPSTFSQGLLVGIKSGNAFTFTHPQNATPASDLTASYTWSKDLATFLANGATDGAFTKVDFTTQLNTPSPGITTVTATVTGTAASKLFVRVNVTQP